MTLLHDALERTLKDPQCALRWHALMRLWRSTDDETLRRSVLDAVAAVAGADARGDILRLTFLAGAFGEARFENAAAERVLAGEAIDADRLAAFMAHRWLSALQQLDGRRDFVAALSSGRLPEMARCLMRLAAGQIPAGLTPRAPAAIRRVAVVVPYVGNQVHTPSLMAVEQCAVLARQGCQIRIFSAQELAPPDAALFRGDGSELNLPALDVPAWAKMLPAGVGLSIADSRFSLPGRWRSLMPLIADFNPDLVLLVGLFSPLAAALYTLRPVVGLSVHTVAPIAPVDVWLSAEANGDGADVWGDVFAPPRPLFHPYRVKRACQPSSLTRAELGLGAEDVVWVSAGFRLEHEIRGEWARRMAELVSRLPNVVWLLIGGEGRLPQDLLQAPAGRVRALPTRSDLPAVFRLADIYVNPPRMGGGFSVAEAMAEGLPVTALAGADGGDKLGELALPDCDAYLARLAALSASASLRAELGATLRQRFTERFDVDASGPALLAACQQAASLAAARFTAAS